jgi:hypothetical protein
LPGVWSFYFFGVFINDAAKVQRLARSDLLCYFWRDLFWGSQLFPAKQAVARAVRCKSSLRCGLFTAIPQPLGFGTK